MITFFTILAYISLIIVLYVYMGYPLLLMVLRFFVAKHKNNNIGPPFLNQHPTLVFTGYMDYFANEDGVDWFCKNVFSKIKAEIPDVQFYIVGNRPTRKVINLSKIDGVYVTGYVEDIREYYWMATICVIPLRIARGLQNKVLEAMATGNAVVATSNASDGIICDENVDIVIADNAEEFAQKTISLLKDDNRIAQIGKKARENILQNYSWLQNMNKFDCLISNK